METMLISERCRRRVKRREAARMLSMEWMELGEEEREDIDAAPAVRLLCGRKVVWGER